MTTWANYRDQHGAVWTEPDRPPRPAAWLRGEARRQVAKLTEEIAALQGLANDIRDEYEGEDRRQRSREILALIQDLTVDLALARRLLAEPPLTWDDLPPRTHGSLIARGRWSTLDRQPA